MEATVKPVVDKPEGKRRHRSYGQLEAMRKAMKTRDREGGRAEVQVWRQFLRENPEKFLGHLARMEAAHQAQKGKGSEAGKPPPGPEKMDEGTERVLALLAELKGGGG